MNVYNGAIQKLDNFTRMMRMSKMQYLYKDRLVAEYVFDIAKKKGLYSADWTRTDGQAFWRC